MADKYNKVLFFVFMCAILVIGTLYSISQSELSWIDLDDTSNELKFSKNINDETQNVFVFGFDRRLEIKEDVRMYMNLIHYLEETTGYQFELHVTPKHKNIVDEIGVQAVDFAAIGMGSYLQAKQKHNSKILVHGKTTLEDQSGQYQAVVFTRKDSTVYGLNDLRNKSVAFGSRFSTQGHLIPRIMLQQAEVTIDEMADFGYVDTHVNVVNAVLSGLYDAGAIQDQLGKRLEKQDLIRVIAVSDFFPSSGIAVSNHVDHRHDKKPFLLFFTCLR